MDANDKREPAATVIRNSIMESTIDDLEKARIGQVYRSRKNRVFRVSIEGETFVAKLFPPGQDEMALHEYSVLQGCVERGVRVPRPVKLLGRSILMEFVEGRTAAEVTDASPDAIEPTLLLVADWLSVFHKAHGLSLCRGDCVLHNFLMTSNGVLGIDFEEAHLGNPIEDLGQVIASFLSMRPAFTDGKMVLARRVVSEYMEGYGPDGNEAVPRAVSDALRHYAQFRPDGDLLNSWADKIGSRGLVSWQE
ncbi:MAG: phosphotransferase [Candidatus Thermoplasmatota archaeon]|nr:phosphotransferase [Candidatus Thermoplasmatota archaeon]